MLNQLFDSLSSFFSSSKRVMCFTFILGLVLSIISIIFTTSIYRDSIQYAAMVNGFNIGDWGRAFREWLPPLYPFLSGLLCKIGFSVYYSMMIVASLLCILTIFPLYGILCFFLEKKYAAWGTLFYLLAPKVMRLGFAPLTESGKYFLFTLSVYFVFKFSKSKRIRDAIFLGIALGVLALARAEGIIYLPIMLFALVVLQFKDNRYKMDFIFIVKIAIWASVTFFTLLIIVSPRLYQIYESTGYPALDTRKDKGIMGFERILFNIEVKSSFIKGQCLAQDYDTVSDAIGVFSAKEDIKEFFKAFPRGAYELYLVMGIFGLMILTVKKKWNIYYMTAIWILIAHLFIFYLMRAFTYRYYVVCIIMLMPFTITGFVQLLSWAEKFKLKNIFTVSIIALAIIQIVNGMDNCIDTSKLYYKNFSYWIKSNKDGLKKVSESNITILVYGDDFGYGLYSDSNVVNYMDVSRYKLNDVLTK